MIIWLLLAKDSFLLWDEVNFEIPKDTPCNTVFKFHSFPIDVSLWSCLLRHWLRSLSWEMYRGTVYQIEEMIIRKHRFFKSMALQQTFFQVSLSFDRTPSNTLWVLCLSLKTCVRIFSSNISVHPDPHLYLRQNLYSNKTVRVTRTLWRTVRY